MFWNFIALLVSLEGARRDRKQKRRDESFGKRAWMKWGHQ